MPINISDFHYPTKKQPSGFSRWWFWMLIGGMLLFFSTAGFIWLRRPTEPSQSSEQTASKEALFITDVYSTIQNEYWQVLSDDQLSTLFSQALSQTYGTQPVMTEKSVKAVSDLVEELVEDHPEVNHEEQLALTADLVLSTLQPAGRSRLYSQTQATDLQNRVANRDQTTDLFETLEIDKTASDAAILQAYNTKQAEIEQTATSAAQKQAQLAQIERAYQALGSAVERERYQKTQVEPTISANVLSGGVFYLKLKQFSPTTVQDLQTTMDRYQSQTTSPSMILDLRGNVGGAIDGLPYFLAPFLGNNLYAYQFFSRGTTYDFKTKGEQFASFKSFKRMVVLVDNQTQSSAEVLAAVLKKYHRAVIVGTPTKGWGTVEKVFPLSHQLSNKTQYSVFLVHSLTLDEAGNPIEGTGVQPHIPVTDTDWPQQLTEYYSDQTMVTAVKSVL